MRKIEAIEITQGINSIEELFKEWKKAHEGESEESCKKTFPKGRDYSEDFKKSFTVDGKFDDNVSDIKILFICRESNVDTEPETNDRFWMKEVINKLNKECLDSKTKRCATKYFNCISEIAKGFGEVSLKKCAYMNINKRGGQSSCNMTRLRNYSVAYEKYIAKEICLLKPEKIVILGNLPKETSHIIATKDIPIYTYPKHPSVYSKDKINDFRNNKEKYLWGGDINE